MKSQIVAAVLVFGFACWSPSALAGQKYSRDVTVIKGSTTGTAFGILSSARNSPDEVQRIGCQASATSGNATLGARCEASDAQGVYVSCSTNEPQMVQLVLGIGGDSSVSFNYATTTAGQPARCTSIVVDNNSLYQPKAP